MLVAEAAATNLEGCTTGLDTEDIKNRDPEEAFEDFSSDDSLPDKNYVPSSSEQDYNESSEDDLLNSSDTEDVGDTDDASNSEANRKNASSLFDNSVWHNVEKYQLPFNVCNELFTAILDENIKKEPLEIYRLFLTDELVEFIVVETNRFAKQCILSSSRKSRLKSWTDTNKEEILHFFSVVMVMGLNQLPTINSYWSKDSIFKNEFIANTMTRDRFLLLFRCIHFCNNEDPLLDVTDPNTMTRDRFLLLFRCIHFCNNEDPLLDVTDRLYKIRKPIEMLNKNFQTVLKPGKILVIDESIIPFRGWLKFRQYIPNKSHNNGIKIYKLCTVNGYTYNTIIYTGRNDKTPEQSHSETIVHQLLKSVESKEGHSGRNDKTPEQSHSETIVHQLLKSVESKEGHYLYGDKFYSSLPLAKSLFEQKIVYCGALRSNRKEIPISFTNKIKRGEVYGQQNDCVKIIKWVDKRSVLMLTTDPLHTTDLVPTGKRSRKGDLISIPSCVQDYNKAKKGVDFSDQMSSYHTILRRGLKWYRKVMFELFFGTCTVNAWIIYNHISNTKVSITEFRISLAKQLAKVSTKTSEPTRKRSIHTFIKPTGSGRKKRKMCQGCYQNLRLTSNSREANKKVSKVTSYCSSCPGMPGMCLTCFNKIHQA
ncbi:Transposase IS4 [Popillia japonica]|uniref:Transposase IS4 n=1 Tax=Popillia japonica TaxID=7064 RepID=A0AAW1MYI8_POPJA